MGIACETETASMDSSSPQKPFSREPLLEKGSPTIFAEAELSLKNAEEGKLKGTCTPASHSVSISFFNWGQREPQDRKFAVLFLSSISIFVILGVCFSINAIFSERGPQSQHKNEVSTCPFPSLPPTDAFPSSVSSSDTYSSTEIEGESNRGPLSVSQSSLEDFSCNVHILLSVVLANFLGITFIWLLQVQTERVVYACLLLVSAMPIVTACLVLAWMPTDPNNTFIAAALVLISCIWAFVIFRRRDRLELTIKILRVAAEFLKANRGLFLLLPFLQLALLLSLGLITVFAVAAGQHGSFVPKRVDFPSQPPDGRQACGVWPECCEWQPSTAANLYALGAMFLFFWVYMLFQELLVFFVASTVGQWYYSPAGTSTDGNLKRAIGHATGPGFGTVCFSSLLMFVMEILRELVRHATQTAEGVGAGALLACLIRCCLEWVLNICEFLTRFATMYASMTGNAFWDSARGSLDLLSRNLLSVAVVDGLSSLILNSAAFLTSCLWGLIVGVSFHLEWNEAFGDVAFGLGVMCALYMVCVLRMFLWLVYLAVEAVYICYAVDKDFSVVTLPQVHNCYALISSGPSATPMVGRLSR